MLSIQVKIEGDKVVIDGLRNLAASVPQAIAAGLFRAAMGVHREAFAKLSGPGLAESGVPGGAYPVPVRTGWLRRMLDFVPPGASKSSGGLTFTAGALEAIVYNAAAYASVIHEGTHSSSKHGKRPFLTDGLQAFGDAKIKDIMEDEIQKAIAKHLTGGK